MDVNDPNYDSGEERRALAFHSRKVEQIKAYKQAVSHSTIAIAGLNVVSGMQMCNRVTFNVTKNSMSASKFGLLAAEHCGTSKG